MSGLYKGVVLLHVLAVLGGLVAVGVTGGYCAALWRRPGSRAAHQFFAPGPGMAPRLLYPAAVLGLAAAASSGGRVHPGSFWVWGAALLWVAGVAAMETVMRPAEHRIQTGLRAPAATRAAGTRDRPWEPGPELLGAARRGLAGALATEACLVAASLLMTIKS